MNIQSQSDKYVSNKIAAPSEFEDVYTHFYTAQNKTNSPIRKTLLPSYHTILVFNFGKATFFPSSQNEAVDIGKCLVLGPVKRACDYTLGPQTGFFVVNFKDDAFHRFFGRTLVSGHDALHPDELVEEDCFSHLWKQLMPMKSAEERAAYLVECCRPYLSESDETVQKITAHDSDDALDPQKTVADTTRQSKRNVQLKHKRHLGYSAKEYARYRRFLKTIAFLQQRLESIDEQVDWFEVIDQNGYYDQPHLIRDFRLFLNITPSQYLTLHRDICI